MTQATANGISIEYESFGREEDAIGLLKVFPGMGHDFPAPLLEEMAEQICRLASRV